MKAFGKDDFQMAKRIVGFKTPVRQQSTTRSSHLHRMDGAREEAEGEPTNDMTSDSALTCSLCLEVFQDPRLLPCLHTFCRRCLENHILPRSKSFLCPTCKKDVVLTENGVPALPPNFVINTMIDLMAVRNSDSKPILCSSCDDRLAATARCCDCMDYLCSACRNAHDRLRLTKGHQVVTLDELRSTSCPEDLLHRPIFCPEHHPEKVRYYCETCSEAICRECTLSRHGTARHKCLQVNEAIGTARSVIVNLLEKTKRKVPTVQQAVRDVEEVTCRLEARSEVAKSEIHKCFPRITKALQDREKSMLSQVENTVQVKSQVLNTQQTRLENELSKLSTTNDFADKVLKHGNETEILAVKKLLCDRLQEMNNQQIKGEPEQNDVIYFVSNHEAIFNAIQNLGAVRTSNAYGGTSSIVADAKRVPRGKRARFSIVTRDQASGQCREGGEQLQVNILSPDGKSIPIEVEDTRDGTYSISYLPQIVGSYQVSVMIRDKPVQGSPFKIQAVNMGQINVKFGRKGSEISEFNGIFGVAVDDDDRIIVTDCHNHRVQVFTPEGGYLFHFGRKGEGNGQFQCPTGVGVDGEGRIVVCERLSSRIQIFNRDGAFVHKFNIPDLKASTLAVDKNGRIVVADSANRCIHVLYIETGQSFKFGSFGDASGELNYPCYVAVNQQGYIFVSDMHSHKIQVFDPRGSFIYNFGRKGTEEGELCRPTGVAVTPEGRVIVADRDNHRMQVFSKEGKYISKFGTKGDGDGQLNDPHGVAVSRDGNVVVADFRNNRVQVFGGNN